MQKIGTVWEFDSICELEVNPTVRSPGNARPPTQSPRLALVTLLEAYRSNELSDFHRLAPDAFQSALETPHASDRAALAGAVEAYLKSVIAPKASLEMAAQLGILTQGS